MRLLAASGFFIPQSVDNGLVLSLSDSLSASRHTLESFGNTLVGGVRLRHTILLHVLMNTLYEIANPFGFDPSDFLGSNFVFV